MGMPPLAQHTCADVHAVPGSATLCAVLCCAVLCCAVVWMKLLGMPRLPTSNSEMLRQLIQGYPSNSWFATASSIAALDQYKACYYQGGARPLLMKRKNFFRENGSGFTKHCGPVCGWCAKSGELRLMFCLLSEVPGDQV